MQIKLQHAAGLALLTAFISGTSNFIAKIAVTAVKDPVVFTFLKNALVAVFLLGILLLATRFRELKTIDRHGWIKLIAIAVVGGSIPFVLFFTGLSMTSALSAGLFHKSLFIWVALLAIPFLKERIGGLQAAALVLLIAGNAVLGGFSAFHFGRGELLILAATLLWAVENIIAKKGTGRSLQPDRRRRADDPRVRRPSRLCHVAGKIQSTRRSCTGAVGVDAADRRFAAGICAYLVHGAKTCASDDGRQLVGAGNARHEYAFPGLS